MDRLNSTIDAVNAFAWGPPMPGIMGVTGVLPTLGHVFTPWRKVGYGFRLPFDKSGTVGEGEVKPFNALMTALSATVGTGNIAGVATAIALGGPGAIFRRLNRVSACGCRFFRNNASAAICHGEPEK